MAATARSSVVHGWINDCGSAAQAVQQLQVERMRTWGGRQMRTSQRGPCSSRSSSLAVAQAAGVHECTRLNNRNQLVDSRGQQACSPTGANKLMLQNHWQ